MKTKIMILNVLDYSKEGKEGVRVSYVLCDKTAFVDNERYRGLTEVNSFYTSRNVYTNITNEMIGKSLDGNFISKQDFKNPLKTTSILASIEYNGRTIELVQSQN